MPEFENQPDLWGTYWIFDEPGMDSILDQAGDCLKDFLEKTKLAVVNADDQDRLFLARYELIGYLGDFLHADGIVDQSKNPIGFVDFLCGFGYGDIEMMGVVGELSTKPDKIDVVQDNGAAPPMPKDLFTGIEDEKILHNYLWLPVDGVDVLAKNLSGTEDTKNPHWWLRWNIINRDAKWPTPGEMLFLGVRLFPTSPWGDQKSSPLLFSGNWMDTLYYSNAKVTSVIDATDDAPYKTYKVKWRKHTVTAKPTDFTEYKVGDRVAILKNPPNSKMSATWDLDDKDQPVAPADGATFDEKNWLIIPITFYEVGK